MIVNVFPIGYRHRPMSHQLSISTSKHSFDEIDVKTRFFVVFTGSNTSTRSFSNSEQEGNCFDISSYSINHPNFVILD